MKFYDKPLYKVVWRSGTSYETLKIFVKAVDGAEAEDFVLRKKEGEILSVQITNWDNFNKETDYKVYYEN